MKVSIVTNVLYKSPPVYIGHTDWLKEAYCGKHGMTYLRYSENPLPGMHPQFSKFEAIRKALKDTSEPDWVVWMDCDAAPLNMKADIREWLADKPRKVIMLKDALGWNSGVFCVPNCLRAGEWLEWLSDIQNIRRFDRGFRDQDEMAWTFGNNFPDFIREDGYDFGLNAYDDIYPHENKPNLYVDGKSWCLHLPGVKDDYRNERFMNLVRKAKGLPSLTRVRKEGLDGMTVADYIKEGAKNILIDYPHGLGDLIMFYPHFKAFTHRKGYEHIRFSLKAADAFTSLLPWCTDEDTFDTIIWFPARFNEREPALKGMTKPQANVVYDLGGEYDPSLDYTEPLVAPLENRFSRFVGLNFCCSCYPREGNCPERTARMLWEAVQGAGFIPIEVFAPKTSRAENARYSFVKMSMRDVGLGIGRMMDVLRGLRGMASVSTGTWHYGMAAYPAQTLYLRNQFDEKCYTSKECLVLDVNRPDQAVIGKWLERLKEI